MQIIGPQIPPIFFPLVPYSVRRKETGTFIQVFGNIIIIRWLLFLIIYFKIAGNINSW